MTRRMTMITENMQLLHEEDPFGIDDTVAVSLKVFQCVFIIIGILLAWVGNGAACYAVYQARRHDPVLGTFIVNLLINDLLISICDLPLTLLTLSIGRWPLGSVMCEISAFLNRTFMLALPWSICCVAIDKYCAVVHAMYYRYLLTPFRCYCLIVGLWVIACFQAMLPLVGFSGYRFIPATYQCGIAWDANYYYSFLTCLVGIVIPSIITIYCYACVLRTSLSHGRRVDAPVQLSRISRVVRPTLRPGSAFSRSVSPAPFDGRSSGLGAHVPRAANAYNPKKAVKHVLGICGVFICCWGPFVIIHIALIIMQSLDGISSYNGRCWHLTMSVYFIYINIVLNPYVYIMFNHRMKRALKKSLRRICRRKDKIHRRSTVFVTNYSRNNHDAAMRRHRARYKGGATTLHPSMQDCQIRISDSSTSAISDTMDVLNDKERRQSDQQDELPHWSEHRGSSAFSDFSAATFPDLLPGRISSIDEGHFDDSLPSFVTSTMYGLRLTPGRPSADVYKERNMKETRVSEARHRSTNLHSSEICNRSQTNDVFHCPTNRLSKSEISARNDNQIFLNHADVLHNDATNSSLSESPKSILIPRTTPLSRRALKKGRTVIFSDSVLSSCDKQKGSQSSTFQQNKDTRSQPCRFYSRSPARQFVKSPKYSQSIESECFKEQSDRLHTSCQAVDASCGSDEDLCDSQVNHPQSWSHNTMQHTRKGSVRKGLMAQSDCPSYIPKFTTGLTSSTYDRSTNASIVKEKNINYWGMVRKVVSQSNPEASGLFNDRETSYCIEKLEHGLPHVVLSNDVTFMGDDIDIPPCSPISEISEINAEEIIRDEDYILEEMTSSETSPPSLDGLDKQSSNLFHLILSPANLGKSVLSPIARKRRKGSKRRHHQTSECKQSSDFTSSIEMLEETSFNASCEATCSDKSSSRKKKSLPKRARDLGVKSPSDRRPQRRRSIFHCPPKRSSLPSCVTSEKQDKSSELTIVFEESKQTSNYHKKLSTQNIQSSVRHNENIQSI